MNSPGAQRVFKVVARTAWEDACRGGAFAGSADDRRDGFIHLSQHHQLAGTLARALRWEPSRGGDLFPHLYGELPAAAAVSVRALVLDAEGVPVVPEDLCQC
jgi:uncharacterized protein (DUF952 family)